MGRAEFPWLDKGIGGSSRSTTWKRGGIAERIDSALTGANSFHEHDAVAEGEPVDGRDLVHVVTDHPRSAVEATLKRKKEGRD
jgi:hypothetical protein